MEKKNIDRNTSSLRRKHRKIYSITCVIIVCISILLLCACGKNNAVREEDITEESAESDMDIESSVKDSVDKEAQNKQDDEEKNGSTSFPGGAEIAETLDEKQDADDESKFSDLDIEEWKSAYLAYLGSLEYADTRTYSLIYVDEDDIPELVIDTGYEAGGKVLLTFHDGVLDEWQSNRLNVTYIEKGNLICNSDGNMGYYYDDVYTIRDGKWCFVAGGKYGDGPDGVQIDENGNYIAVYIWHGQDMQEDWDDFWSGEQISEEAYMTQLNRVYPTEQAAYPERYYVLDEIYSILRTGDVASAGHRYELLVEDLTWKEAEAACREKGGYLAAITSWEELERIQEQMIAEEKTGITFFVGANNEREDGTRGYHWIEPMSGAVYNMLDLYNALFHGFWLEDEPSYTGLTEAGVEVEENYVVLLYRKSDSRCYLNDVPNDILSAAPSYAGSVGYICEYDL